MNRARLAWIVALGLFAVPSISAQQAQRGPSANDAPRTLSKNTKVEAKTTARISSQSNKIGDTVQGTISKDVKDASGAIVFPSGSPVVFEIVDLVPPDATHKDGALALAIQKVEVGGQ